MGINVDLTLDVDQYIRCLNVVLMIQFDTLFCPAGIQVPIVILDQRNIWNNVMNYFYHFMSTENR